MVLIEKLATLLTHIFILSLLWGLRFILSRHQLVPPFPFAPPRPSFQRQNSAPTFLSLCE